MSNKLTSLYLLNKLEYTRKLASWMIILQEFEFIIVHVLVLAHAVADHLFHLESCKDSEVLHDDFSDANLFKVVLVELVVTHSWYNDML